MMQISSPSQRKFTPGPRGPRRVASVPVRLGAGFERRGSSSSTSEQCAVASTTTPGSAAAASAQNIDLLFAHSSAKIVSFSAVGSGGRLLPWTSPAERTIASGPIRIYKTIPHDIAFLQSGSALRPVLSRSQCWNVDGRGTFCLQIRPGSFWRLEILEPEDAPAVKAIEFSGVLVKILAYEVTACPFQRTGENCVSREAEVFGTLQPSKVWRRPSKVAELADLGEVEEISVQGFEKKELVAEEEEEEAGILGGLESPPAKIEELKEGATNTLVDISRKDVSHKERAVPSSVGPMMEWNGFKTPDFSTDTNTFPTISTRSSRTSTPSPSRPTSPTTKRQSKIQSQEIRIAKRRERATSLIDVRTEPRMFTNPSQDSPTPSNASTPSLWSGSDSQSEENWSESVSTPPRNTPPHRFDPISTTTKPRLTRSASQIMLSGGVSIANLVVIKPSSYIAGLMFSIAAKIASRAVTGAAYTLTEKIYSTDMSIEALDDDDVEAVLEYEDDYGVYERPRKTRVGAWDEDWGVE
ncbi:uncharacterized protein H6S33_013086 [Morchella sextelata]|uniref:uncharacterized protein n=1 Tax=Morchella sextelata TaxID=1174677 RepID=UPI001D04EC4C|nr:uncharacterized protein H6S33_013086 [Morchella sextelata]KAH0609600.1 hypothetical protein H6S33_013086 [Morchella sextelata]